MALNNDNIYRYNFSSRSNPKWNFQLDFLRGDDDFVGTYDSSPLPDMFIDGISILSDMPDDLPFGKAKASLLNLKFNLDVLEGDFLVLKDWLMVGGQTISSVYYPNQFRVLSNNGRGASDTTYNVVEFWGAQDIIPEQEYKFEFGKMQTFELKILSLENYLLNKVTNFNLEGDLFANVFIDYFNFEGVNSSTQNVFLGHYSRNFPTVFHTFTPNTFMGWLNTQLNNASQTYLRNWLNSGTIDNSGTYLEHWDFNKQLYDLTTQVGAGLSSNTEIKMISVIKQNVGGTVVGGLFSEKSKDGFYQFKNANDLLNSLCEQFITKLTFQYFATGTPKLLVNFKPAYDSLNGGSISLDADNIINELTLKRGNFTINESTVSYKAYKSNQNKNTYKVYGSLKQDSYDNKALFTNNVQVATIDDFLDARDGKLPYHLINLLYYVRGDGKLFLTHANCSVALGTESSKVISNESIAGDTIDPADNLSSGNKEINRAKLIEWSNLRYNKSGLNYVQSKAYTSIMNDKSILIEADVYDYVLMPRYLGEKVICDFGTILDLPSEWFFTNNHVLVSCEIDLLTGISKNKLFVRGE